MTRDPYSFCPCGTGTKFKWCQAKNEMPQLESAIEMIQNGQQDASLAALDKIIGDKTLPECFRMYAETVKSQALEVFGRRVEGMKLLEDVRARYPNYGLPIESMGDVPFSHHVYDVALEFYPEAMAHYPAEATHHRCRTLLKLGTSHAFQGRPLAAWAAWQRALKIDPQFKAASDSIQEFIKNNRLLPNQARQGLSLKKPDEFTLFHEESAERWQKAAREGEELSLDDLVSTFEALAAEDSEDAVPWYNLALALAWRGDNLRALEALEKYVDREADLDAAADAWDLGEVLRLGAGAESLSDCLEFVAVYELASPEVLFDKLKTSRRIAVVGSEEGPKTLHWMSKDLPLPEERGAVILGGPPRSIAQLMLAPHGLEIRADSQSNRDDVMRQIETLAGTALGRSEVFEIAGNPESLDREPIEMFDDSNKSEAEQVAGLTESVRGYFEDRWLTRPLRSLKGSSPIDAAQNAKLRRKLEGVIRFRERNFARHGIPYNFDRLRNKLGLPIAGEGLAGDTQGTGTTASPDVDFSAYSAAQLAALEPSKLSDDEILSAYKAAMVLDVKTTAGKLGENLVKRPGMAERTDVGVVYRKIIGDRLQHRDLTHLESLIQDGRESDRSHQGGRDAAYFDLYEARLKLLQKDVEAGMERLGKLLESHPDRLDVFATGVESLLAVDQYTAARDLAEKGLARAEKLRNRDLQGQFREYLHIATERLKKGMS